jgi:hypothetical protein
MGIWKEAIGGAVEAGVVERRQRNGGCVGGRAEKGAHNVDMDGITHNSLRLCLWTV